MCNHEMAVGSFFFLCLKAEHLFIAFGELLAETKRFGKHNTHKCALWMRRKQNHATDFLLLKCMPKKPRRICTAALYFFYLFICSFFRIPSKCLRINKFLVHSSQETVCNMRAIRNNTSIFWACVCVWCIYDKQIFTLVPIGFNDNLKAVTQRLYSYIYHQQYLEFVYIRNEVKTIFLFISLIFILAKQNWSWW